MKKYCFLFITFVLISCSSTKNIDSWRSPEYLRYQPKKVLLLGVTNNLTARTIFEEKMKDVFSEKGIQAVESYQIFKPDFTSLEQTEESIQNEVEYLSNQGFDTVLIATVKGVDEKVVYDRVSFRYPHYFRRFGHYYYVNQEIFFNNHVYDSYKIYHIEISLFSIVNKTDKSLVWVGSYDIVDPKKIKSSIRDCIKSLQLSLEQEGIIPL